MSDSNIYNQLRKVQQELKVPKGQMNSFGGYKYRSCEDILEAVKPLLDKYELTILVGDEVVNIGDRYYVKAQAAVADGTTMIEAYGFAREDETKKGMDGAQITGAASSYARKYALNGLFAIDDTKDADSDEHTAERQQSAPKAPARPVVGTAKTEDATPAQRAQIKAFLTSKGLYTPEAMVKHLEDNFGIIPGSIMTKADADDILMELAS